MGISEAIMSIMPEKYRRDVTVLALGAGLAVGGVHFEGRIDTAYAAAATTAQLQLQIVDMKTRQQLLEAQSATTQSNQLATKQEVDMLVQGLLNRQALPTAPAVVAPKGRR